MIKQLGTEELKKVLTAYPSAKARIENLKLAVEDAKFALSDGGIYRSSVLQRFDGMPGNPQPSDKTCNIAVALAEAPSNTKHLERKISALETISAQVDNAMGCLSPRQRYVVEKRCMKASPTKWEFLAMDAGEKFDVFNIDTYKRDFSKALEAMVAIIEVDERAYKLYIDGR